MILSIHQPSYFPWLGLLDKINKSDKFIILDNVQLADRAYQHRNIFLNNNGKENLLTINISKKGYRNKTIKEIELSSNEWQKKHFLFFQYNYAKHPFYEEIITHIESIYSKEYKYLIDVLYDSLICTLKMFKIDVEIDFASNIVNDNSLKKEDLILEITKNCNATTYLSGTGAKAYQSEINFNQKNINLKYQQFKHPCYKQFKQDQFTEGLSSLDILFNLGINNSSKLLRK